DCRLQTVERYVCGRRRVGDVPGAQIPEVYHRFVETGDARLVAPILRHNAQDLVTVAEVLLKCLG
ncbi:MAG: exonuclease, partial [Xanthomonadales bacterium]|nr:exonuclease [Xanthomonadales bacterium]NIO14328.1 exonuclease [Xanthomonadales bacterium]